MAEDTAKAETVVSETPKNEAPAPETPVVEKATDAEVERLRKQAEQAEMRANQLQNQLKAKEEAEAEAARKKLEENQEFKTLAEQERARREELEAKIEAEERAKELASQKAEVLKDFPDEVKGLAEDAGIELTDTSDEAVAAFKERLDKVSKRVNVKVAPNNPGVLPQKSANDFTREELRQILNDPVKRDEYYRKYKPITAAMMNETE